MEDIEDFVLRGSQKITPAQIASFHENIPLVLAKIDQADPPRQPHLREQAEFLLRFVEDCLDGEYEPDDASALAEALFAVMYLDKGVDIIPDIVPDIGYADDSAILRTVLRGHGAEFTKYGRETGVKFSDISLAE